MTEKTRFALLTGGVLLLIAITGTVLLSQRVRSITGTTPAAAESAGNLHIGGTLPEFTVHDADGNPVKASSLVDGEHFVVVNFHHPGCPCAENCGRLISRMEADGYGRDVRFIGIMPHDTRTEWVLADLEAQKEAGTVTFPVYFDHDGTARELLGATRTPEVWVLDKDGTIAYWGAPESTLFPGTREHRFLLREAVDALREGRRPEVVTYEPIGCLIPEEG